MILLSALLASLTGLAAGERPATRAQVELSTAAAAIVQPGDVAGLPNASVAAAQPRLGRHAVQVVRMVRPTPVPTVRMRLSIKQSWLN